MVPIKNIFFIIIIEAPVSSQESERSSNCVLGYPFSPFLQFFCWILELFPHSDIFLFFILLLHTHFQVNQIISDIFRNEDNSTGSISETENTYHCGTHVLTSGICSRFLIVCLVFHLSFSLLMLLNLLQYYFAGIGPSSFGV